MSNNVNWADLIRESKNILLEGDSHFEGLDAMNEIINILLLKWGEHKYTSEHCIDTLYKKYCARYDKTKDKKSASSLIAELYHFQKKVYDKFSDEFGIILNTSLTINHKYDLANLVIAAYHYFKDATPIFDKTLICEIKKYFDASSLDPNILKTMIEEINPKKNEVGSDECCGVGDFLISVYKHNKNANMIGKMYTENVYKFALLNLICHNINYKLLKYESYLSELNYDQNATCDYIIGTYDKEINTTFVLSDYIKFPILTKNNIILQIQMCLHKLKDKGRCGLVLPQHILYSNGINKNSPSLETKLTTTCEYQIRKLLLEEHNLYKIVAFSNNLFGVFFVKGKRTTQIEFIEGDSKLVVDIDKIKDNMYCLLSNIYKTKNTIHNLESINKNDLVQSKVMSCSLNNKKHERLNYRSILHRIYKIIGVREKIKKKTLLNIECGQYTEKGYKYIEDLDMSIQGTDSFMTLGEIVNQCKVHKIKLNLEIRLDRGDTVVVKNKYIALN